MKIPAVQWHYYKSLNTIKLLLGNVITIFVGVFLYMKAKGVELRDEEDKTLEKQNIAKDEEKREDDNKSVNQGSELQEETNGADNYTGKNETIEIIDQVTSSAASSTNNTVQFGIIATTILIVIIFSILLIKRQIKLKKKLSK